MGFYLPLQHQLLPLQNFALTALDDPAIFGKLLAKHTTTWHGDTLIGRDVPPCGRQGFMMALRYPAYQSWNPLPLRSPPTGKNYCRQMLAAKVDQPGVFPSRCVLDAVVCWTPL